MTELKKQAVTIAGNIARSSGLPTYTELREALRDAAGEITASHRVLLSSDFIDDPRISALRERAEKESTARAVLLAKATP